MRRLLSALSVPVWLCAATALAQDADSAAPEAPAPVAAPAPGEDLVGPAAPAGADEPEPSASGPDEYVGLPVSEEEATLSASELEALGFDTSSGGEVSALDTDLHVSGFADFNISQQVAKKDSLNRTFLPRYTNFYVGNFNVYLSKNLSETFRTMGEVRFSYAPNGHYPSGGSDGTPTTGFPDYADFDREFKWGAIEIERVYLEWAPSRYVAVRAGQFLTPYGIWNVDHGSPTYIPVQRPYAVAGSLFPERQTGLELFGRWDATNNGTLGYHLTLSNGGGPISEYRDLDDNKAVGGRLYWEQHGIGRLKFGGSIYYGEDTDATSTAQVDSMGMLKPAEDIHYQFEVLSLAADIAWNWKGLLLQAEWVSQQRHYTDQGRHVTADRITQAPRFPIDVMNWSAYALAGYRLPWFGIMPYCSAGYVYQTQPGGYLTRASGINGGLNIRPIDAVVFKLEYMHTFQMEKLLGISGDSIRLLQAQAAWAF